MLPPAFAEQLVSRGWRIVDRETSREAPGGGAGGQGWVVVDRAGHQDDLTLVPVPAEHRERALVVERLGVLRALDHEHLAAIDEIVEGDPGHLGILTRRPHGTGLDLLLRCRGPLSAGEAATLLVPLAQALAALHQAGQTYGALGRRDVTVGPDGRAVLRAPLVASTASPAEDVRALAALVTGLVPPPATLHPGVRGAVGPGEGNDEAALAALHAELAAAQRADPRGRPEAGTFAALCYEAAPPLPLVLPDPARLAAAAIAERSGPRGPAAGRAVVGEASGLPPRDEAGAGGAVVRPARVRDGGALVPATRAETRARAPERPRRGGETAGRAVPTARRSDGRSGRRGGGGRSRGPRHPALVVALVLTVCAALAGGGLALRSWAGDTSGARDPALAGPRTGGQDASGDDPTRHHDDPLAAAVELTERRVELLAGDRALAEVVVPGSPAEQADAELLERIADTGVVVEGARAEVLDARNIATGGLDAVSADAGSPDQASVEVTYVVGAHTQRAADGTVIEVPAEEPEVAVLTLRWTDGAWRVGEVG
ncbi:hypothetical protein [Oerskovia enterophila]|uniref:Non-specific serine/threonine protein kinase n=1 Tax=Oerskovia enterophila TaxID=43678 RepID=A0ABX2YAF2_9CELL|nr:hypothetical protein [Oerskovia enterophila]OCI30945.1 hypothetical protein OERS_24000 [Oerskovia enterophila]